MIYFLLADGFEETEAVAPYDMVKRAGCDAVFVSASNSLTVTGSHGIKITADMFIGDISIKGAEMIVLPGGKTGVENIDKAHGFDTLIKSFVDNSKFIAAICAAPSLLGKRGYLDGVNAVCYPSPDFEKALKNAFVLKTRVVKDGNFITAIGAGASIEFGLALVAALKGRETAEKIKAAIQ